MERARAASLRAAAIAAMAAGAACHGSTSRAPDLVLVTQGDGGGKGGPPGCACATPLCDCTAPAGVDYRVTPEPPAPAAPTDPFGGGIALADFDGDGDPDLLLTSPMDAAALLRNRGDGTFEDASAAFELPEITRGRGPAAGDYDNDGDVDLYVGRAGPDNPNFLLRNDGGRFSDVTAESGTGVPEHTYTSLFCDLTRDGRLDLLVGVYSASYDTRQGFGQEPNRLFVNAGGDRFLDRSDESGLGSVGMTLGLACSDVDGDGDLDVYEVNDFGMCAVPNRLWINDGAGRFTDQAGERGADTGMFGMGAAAADYDNDGDMDLYASNICANVLLDNDGRGRFREVARARGAQAWSFPGSPFTEYRCGAEGQCGADCPWAKEWCPFTTRDPVLSGWGMTFLDLDQDGWQDLYLCNAPVLPLSPIPDGHDQPDLLLRNVEDPAGGRRFAWWAPEFDLALPGDHLAVAPGDLDGDGDLDLVVAGASAHAGLGDPDDNDRGQVRVLINHGAAGHALTVRLSGSRSNRDGAGARIAVEAGGRTFVREVHTGHGFATAVPALAHFGLGDADVADRIEVRWPSGEVTVRERVPAGAAPVVIEE